MPGGSVVAYLQKDPQFNIRAVSRNPDSAAAKALAAKGIEVVKAEASDLQSCIKVMKGAWGVFAVTDCGYKNGVSRVITSSTALQVN